MRCSYEKQLMLLKTSLHVSLDISFFWISSYNNSGLLKYPSSSSTILVNLFRVTKQYQQYKILKLKPRGQLHNIFLKCSRTEWNVKMYLCSQLKSHYITLYVPMSFFALIMNFTAPKQQRSKLITYTFHTGVIYPKQGEIMQVMKTELLPILNMVTFFLLLLLRLAVRF